MRLWTNKFDPRQLPSQPTGLEKSTTNVLVPNITGHFSGGLVELAVLAAREEPTVY